VSSAVAGRGALPLAAVRALPAWAWLAGLVVVSIAVRYAFARRMPGPWIMVDELIYSELAKSIADGGGLAIRGDGAGLAYGVVYPLLVSPAYALFESVPDAYAAAKGINAVLMSLAALPAYLIARTVLRPPLALLAAVLAVALPSTLYAGTIMTENAFYPLFLFGALALLRALERPTWRRTVVLLAVVLAAFLTRQQAVVFLPALAVAPLLLVLLDRRGLRALGAYRALYGGLGLVVAAALVLQAARGRSPLSLLGAYRTAGESGYDVSEIARWLLYHVAELDLYLAVVPFAAFLVLAALSPRLERADRVFVAASAPLVVSLLVAVAAFASRHALRIEERNVFYAVPLFVVALLVWIERGLPRPGPVVAVAAGVAAALPALLPYEDLVNVTARSDTFALLALWRVHSSGVALDDLWVPVLVAGAALAALAVLVPRRYALVLPALVLVGWAAGYAPIEGGDQGVRAASAGALFQGIAAAERDWIDEAVGADADVAAVWSGRTDAFTIWENEFFNRSVGRVYHLSGPVPGGLAQAPLDVDEETGLLRAAGGEPVRAAYAFADDDVELAGRELARDAGKGTAVYRVESPLRTTRLVTGLDADGWVGRRLVYTRFRCAGGRLLAELQSDPSLYREPQTVEARSRGGRVLGQVTVAPDDEAAAISVPLSRGPGGRCVALLVAGRTKVPAGADKRRLGFRVVGLRYLP
jgi:hypothetical protein